MKRNTPIINDPGFSILEMTVVLIIMSLLLSAAIPVLSRTYLEKAANKTALDISTIQEAARKFYIDHNQWPTATGLYATAIANLQANGYLPSAWDATNPFVQYEPDLLDFTYQIKSDPLSLTVFTNVPTQAGPIIENLLPTPSVDLPVEGHHVYSTVSVPGSLSSMPVGSIIPWSGFSSNPQIAPGGFLWCNGQAVDRSIYSNLFAVIGTQYGSGDGVSTFNLPDLMGRVIVGVDQMGGGAAANRIIDPRWTSQYAQMGGVLGESAHQQTVSEMAPHAHSINSALFYDSYQEGGSTGGIRSSPWNHGTWSGSTDSTGGNGSGLGAPSNVVQPSMALGYLIKY